MFPSSLLARLFVPGSLKNYSSGFEFKLKNILESGTITGLGAITIDDKNYEAITATVKIGHVEISGDLITRANPINARSMAEIHIRVHGEPLDLGQHKITLRIITAEIGKIQFSVDETLST